MAQYGRGNRAWSGDPYPHGRALLIESSVANVPARRCVAKSDMKLGLMIGSEYTSLRSGVELARSAEQAGFSGHFHLAVDCLGLLPSTGTPTLLALAPGQQDCSRMCDHPTPSSRLSVRLMADTSRRIESPSARRPRAPIRTRVVPPSSVGRFQTWRRRWLQPRLTKSREFSGQPTRGNSRIEGTRPVRSGLPPPPSSPANLDKARTRAGFPYSFRGFTEVGCNTRRAGSAERAALSVPVSDLDFRGERLRRRLPNGCFVYATVTADGRLGTPSSSRKYGTSLGCLSIHRDLLAQRGITVSYEAIRLWCIQFGSEYARSLSVDRAGWATHGTWTRSSSPSRDSGTISGVPSIKVATSLTSSSSRVATAGLPNALSASC